MRFLQQDNLDFLYGGRDLKGREREPKRKKRRGVTEAVVFYNLFSNVTSHPFCHILFIISKSLCPTHIWREEN
jgi:hypothetical protein